MKKFPANPGRENQPDREPQPPSQTGKTITFPGFFSPVFREMNSDWSLSETVLNNFAKKFPMKILTAEVSIKALQKNRKICSNGKFLNENRSPKTVHPKAVHRKLLLSFAQTFGQLPPTGYWITVTVIGHRIGHRIGLLDLQLECGL